MNIKKLISVIVVLCIIIPSYGQKIIETKVIELDDGLNERIVNTIERDAYGYFYIKTENYIQRWDGRGFVEIDVSNLETRGILNTGSQLEMLLDSTLILIPNKSASLYELDVDRKELKKIATDWQEKRDIIFSAARLYTISHQSDKTIVSSLDSKYKERLIAQIDRNITITSLADLKERLIFQTGEGHVNSYLKKSKAIIDHEIKGQVIKSESDNVVIANDEAIYSFKNDVLIELAVDLDIGSNNKNSFLIYSDYDKEGNIAIGHTNLQRHIRKLHVVTAAGEVVNMDAVTVANDRIRDIYADNYFDKMLLGTYNGLYYHKLEDGAINSIYAKSKSNKSNFGHVVYAITHDDNDNIYFTTEAQGLNVYNTISEEIIRLTKAEDLTYFNGNLRLQFDTLSREIVGIGYNNNSTSDIYTYNIDSKKFGKYPLDFLANDFILNGKGKIILTGRKNVKRPDGKNDYFPRIVEYDIKNQEWEKNDLLKDTEHRLSRSLYPYKDYMFVCTTTGLVIADRAMSNIVKVINDKSTIDNIELKANWIVFVKEYNGQLMVGTNGDGVFFIDPITLEVSNKINKVQGLSDNVAVSMEIDHLNNAWVTSFNGINIIDTAYRVVKTIYLQDGLSDREFNSTANITYKEDFYFGTSNGMTIIDPMEFFRKPNSKGLVIDYVELIKSDGGVIRYNDNINDIRINSSFSEMKINVSFPDYYSHFTEDAQKELLVNGVENYTIDKTSVKIPTNVIGAYNLSFINKWNERAVNTYVKVSRDIPWKTLAVILSVIILAYLISKYVINQNIKREKEKTQFNKKISELRLNALKAQMNPHFIFNALGSIQYFIQNKETGRADEYLSKFAKLMRMILESSKSEFISIKDEMMLMGLYIDLEYVRFEGLFNYDINIDFDVDEELEIPPMIIQPLVENAINHGLYNLKNRKGKLELLTTAPQEDLIKIVIRDNGVGRSYKSESKNPKHKSRGMDILKERINVINDTEEMRVTMEINDLMDASKNPRGTEVVILVNYT